MIVQKKEGGNKKRKEKDKEVDPREKKKKEKKKRKKEGRESWFCRGPYDFQLIYKMVIQQYYIKN